LRQQQTRSGAARVVPDDIKDHTTTKEETMNIDWNITKPYWYTTAAWRVAGQPEAIAEALRMGEQANDLLTRAARMIHSAWRDAGSGVQDAPLRCHVILDRLTGETDRLAALLRRLRAAKAVSA
jgi:hypothetical protein